MALKVVYSLCNKQVCSKIFELFVVIIATLAALALVDLCDNRVAHSLEFLELLFEAILVGVLVGVEPVAGFGEGVTDSSLIIFVELVSKLFLIFDGVLHLVDVVLELVTGINSFFNGLVLVGEFLGVSNHLLNLLGGETALVVSDRDGLGLAGTLLVSGHSHDRVLINLEGNLNLGNTTGSGGDSVKVKFTKLMVILNQSTLSFEDSDGDSLLLVLVGSESLGLLGGDDGTSGDNLGHNSSDGLNTESKRGDIDEKQILGLFGGLSSENTSLNGGTVGNGFIGVNTSVGLLSVEHVLNKLLNLGNTGRSTNENDLIDFRFLETRVIENLLDGLEGLLEKIIAEFLKTGTGEGLLEIDTVNKSFNSNLNLDDR